MDLEVVSEIEMTTEIDHHIIEKAVLLEEEAHSSEEAKEVEEKELEVVNSEEEAKEDTMNDSSTKLFSCTLKSCD